MQTITNSTIRTIGIALAVVLMIALSLAIAPKAEAADLDFGSSYDYFVPDYGGSSGSSYDYFVPDYGGSSGSSYDYFVPDYGSSYDYFVSDFGGSSYDYFVPDSGFSSGGSFMGGNGGFSFPGMPIGGSSGGNTQSQNQSQSQSSSNNNTNVNNNVITIGAPVAQATPVCPQGTTGTYPNCVWPTPNCPVGTMGIYPNCIYPTPTYDICPNIPGIQQTLPPGHYIQNGYCYQSYTNPVHPTPVQPYVTLSQVPYTGYEMGPVGTALYWGFLVLWCLLAAYLIVVKKVHNTFVAWLVGNSAPSHRASVAHSAPVVHKSAVSTSKVSGIDPFIASQIHRA